VDTREGGNLLRKNALVNGGVASFRNNTGLDSLGHWVVRRGRQQIFSDWLRSLQNLLFAMCPYIEYMMMAILGDDIMGMLYLRKRRKP
jgi:hypothetical protein